ncbi:hypothetical protein BOTBODRAFT_27031 [Botryobasidium botryosum FD-172 SS1]|uniref:Uncharacterized protein n=1 Tax=Botryobasidium botryosum (strain FD-172 SS1) TaxID=930990 RepID=A0A067NA60_BOTB1|nr:hypothetical protein BOTBODRAFT_27031 [Botryobasidium botryosum FD-172 SS1]
MLISAHRRTQPGLCDRLAPGEIFRAHLRSAVLISSQTSNSKYSGYLPVLPRPGHTPRSLILFQPSASSLRIATRPPFSPAAAPRFPFLGRATSQPFIPISSPPRLKIVSDVATTPPITPHYLARLAPRLAPAVSLPISVQNTDV